MRAPGILYIERILLLPPPWNLYLFSWMGHAHARSITIFPDRRSSFQKQHRCHPPHLRHSKIRTPRVLTCDQASHFILPRGHPRNRIIPGSLPVFPSVHLPAPLIDAADLYISRPLLYVYYPPAHICIFPLIISLCRTLTLHFDILLQLATSRPSQDEVFSVCTSFAS